MKYMLQVRFNGADTMIGRLSAEEQQNVRAEFEAIRQSSSVLDGNQLQAASTEPGGLRRGCYHGPFGATLNLEPLARPPEPVRGGTEAAIWVHEVKPSLARILVTCRIAVAG